MKEIWKDIPNYKGYQVSNLGRIRTFNKQSSNKQYSVRKWKNRILKFKGETYATGYRVDLWKDGKHKTFLVSRLVAFTFKEENIDNSKLTVNHIDGNRFNNNLENLELISLAENINHAFETGLMKKSSYKTKITNLKTKEEFIFRSQEKANIFIGKGKGYISNCIRKNKYSNENYKWEILN